MKKCLNCSKEFEPKRKDAKFDTHKCKLQFNRNQRKGDTDKPRSVSLDTDNSDPYHDEEGRGFTKTDWLFQQDIMGRHKNDRLFKDPAHWYKFGELRKHVACWMCDKPFDTRLPLNRYCSPECRSKHTRAIK